MKRIVVLGSTNSSPASRSSSPQGSKHLYKMKKARFGLLSCVVLAIVLGVVLGSFAPAPFVRGVNTVVALIGQFIKFLVPLIIVGLVAPAIADTGRGAGKLLLATVAIAYCSTLFAGFLGYFVSAAAFPSLVSSVSGLPVDEAAQEFRPYVHMAIPPLMDVMSALVFSFMAGLGMVFTECDTLKRVFSDFRAVVVRTITGALVPLLPLFIFGIFLDMTAAGKAGRVLVDFAAIIAVFTALTLVVIVVQYCVAGVVAGRNPFKAMWKMLPAYMTALGTSSSAATIPVTRAQTLANGVSREIADFTVPLCATVHLAGSTVKIVSCAVALLLVAGRGAEINLATFAGFIATVGIVMIAAPGVPGGAVMSAIGLLESMLGFDHAQIALMIALYLATDSIGTACNIAGDGAIAIVVDKMFGAEGRS